MCIIQVKCKEFIRMGFVRRRNMLIYPVIFTETKDEKDTVLVFIPDLNGMTEG